MPTFLESHAAKAKTFWKKFTFSQRMLVAGIGLTLVAVFTAMVLFLNQTAMVPLYSNLKIEDANRVTSSLDEQKIKYILEQNGVLTAILVPEEQVLQLRIKIAGEGNILGQGIGFEIFDDVKIGQTDFVQKINYQRALQGELARTICEFDAVESARVHLVIPQRSLFIEEQQSPSASIILKLKSGRKIENKDIQAMVNLVSMAIEGLSKNNIAITDSAGKALYKPEEENSLFGQTSVQTEHRLHTQQNLERRIEELLSPVVGAGKVIAKVNAEIDFSQKTIKKESYDPDVAVVRSETRMEEQTQGQANLEAGVPDLNFRGDGLTGSISTQTSNREQRHTNYEINKEEQNIIGSVGDISRLSVAVVLDGTYEIAEDGQKTFVPRSAAELKNIRQLVANVVGFDSARGDTIEVSNIPFGLIEFEDTKDLGSIISDYALRIGKPFLNALLIFVFLLVVVRPIVLSLIRPKVEGEMLEELVGLPVGEERLAIREGDFDEELDAMAILEKIEDIKAHTMQLCEQNMDQAVGILRSWLKADANAKKEKLPVARAA